MNRSIHQEAGAYASGILLTDRNLNIIGANDRFCNISGKSYEQLLHSCFLELIKSDETFLCHHYFEKMRKEELNTFEMETDVEDDSGNKRSFMISVKSLSGSSPLLGYMMMLRPANKN